MTEGKEYGSISVYRSVCNTVCMKNEFNNIDVTNINYTNIDYSHINM